MLVLPGGRERTEEEYAALFAAAGLRLDPVVDTALADVGAGGPRRRRPDLAQAPRAPARIRPACRCPIRSAARTVGSQSGSAAMPARRCEELLVGDLREHPEHQAEHRQHPAAGQPPGPRRGTGRRRGGAASSCCGLPERPDHRAQHRPARHVPLLEELRPRLVLGLRVRAGGPDGERPDAGVGVGVALEQRLDRVLVVLAQRGAPGGHPPGQVDVGARPPRRARARCCVARTRPPRGCAGPGWSGPGRRPARPRPRRAARGAATIRSLGVQRWASSRATLRNGSTTAGLCSRSSTLEHAARTARRRGELTVEHHLEAGDHRQGPVDRRRAGRRRGRAARRTDSGSGRTAANVRSPALSRWRSASGRSTGGLASRGLDRRDVADAGSETPSSASGVASRCRAGAAAGRRRRATVAAIAPSVERAACRCRPGRARRRSSRRGRGRRPRRSPTIRSSSTVLPQACSAEVGAQTLDEGVLADVGHQLLEHARALGVGDRVEVRHRLRDVGHLATDRVGGRATCPGGSRPSCRRRGTWPTRR